MAEITREQVVDETIKDLENKRGVKAAPAVVAGAAAAPAPAALVEEEQTEFEVVLTEVGPEKVAVIKVVRELTGLGLKEAKDLVDAAPSTVKEGVSKADAEEAKKKLTAAGARGEIM